MILCSPDASLPSQEEAEICSGVRSPNRPHCLSLSRSRPSVQNKTIINGRHWWKVVAISCHSAMRQSPSCSSLDLTFRSKTEPVHTKSGSVYPGYHFLWQPRVRNKSVCVWGSLVRLTATCWGHQCLNCFYFNKTWWVSVKMPSFED